MKGDKVIIVITDEGTEDGAVTVTVDFDPPAVVKNTEGPAFGTANVMLGALRTADEVEVKSITAKDKVTGRSVDCPLDNDEP